MNINIENTIVFVVGDHVYYEKSECSPYWVGKIEAFKRTPTGNIMAKVLCYYRRCNLPGRITQIADGINSDEAEDFKAEKASQEKHRELFLTTQTETIPALQFRGKCSVTLLSDTELPSHYLRRDDFFYYCFSFNNMNNTLSIDKKEIHVGSRYQTEIPDMLRPNEHDERECEDVETLLWTPNHGMSEQQIDSIVIVSRSVGMLARSLQRPSGLRPPLLQATAAAASRDCTLANAMELIHKNGYKTDSILSAMVHQNGVMMFRDEMESWTPSEANLFQDALDIYGKNFSLIRSDVLPWKSLKGIVEYYYMWKTTDRSLQLKRIKLEEELKLQSVHMPRSAVDEPPGSLAPMPGGDCSACRCLVHATDSWHGWGSSKRLLCHECWVHWKKYSCHKCPLTIS